MCEFCKHHCWVGINYCPKCGRKVNRMSDNLDKIITNVIEAEKNGVKIIIKQQCDREINDINIDFSEHDKVFEDKIVELKKDYKTASELLGKYQQENEALKKRIIELENFSCQAEQETESLVEKLNQRIAGLEKELEEWKEEASDYDKILYALKNSNEKVVKLEIKLSNAEKTGDDYYNKCIDLTNQIEKLKSELETKVDFETDRLVKLPFDALETANMLINATYRRKANGIDRLHGCVEDTIETDMFSVDDLEQIAEHLLVYCKHNREDEE